MDMSNAALPAISGFASKADQNHPLYNEWRKAEAFNRRNMINGQNFKDWLFQREANANRDDWAKHPFYNSFLLWMRENQGGARKSPGAFPVNFKAWLDGIRW